MFLLMRPVNFTDVSLGLNHQLISFVLIKWLILNMNRTDNECCSEPKPDNAAPATELLEREAGRYREKIEEQEGVRDGWGGGRRMREKVVARAGKSEGAKESPDKSLC